MKDHDTKTCFVELRAEGLSFAEIAKYLHISKSTCSEWERELTDQIATRRGERTQELYTLYGMHHEARIKRMGETLNRINAALEAKDLSDLPADKLLSMKLQYEKAIREEYHQPSPTTFTEDGLISSMLNLLTEQQNGTINHREAKQQLDTIKALLSQRQNIDNRDPFNWHI